jgi:ribosomal protein S18 acetylase RimI-like enzyme
MAARRPTHRALLSAADLDAIRELADICEARDGSRVKLNWDLMRARPREQTNDFLWHEAGRLAGYAALDGFGGEYETTGLVHPAQRRHGIGRRLLAAVIAECQAREAFTLLLVCAHASESGRAFIAAQGEQLRYDFSEQHMQLDAAARARPPGLLQLRQATVDDVPAVAHIRARAFDEPEQRARGGTELQLAEPGSTIYVAELEGTPVGTICALLEHDGVYLRALSVLPEQQGRGYGRAILNDTVGLLRAAGHARISLDVATNNEHALRLYESCGFVATSRYDYYAVDLSNPTPA